MDEQSYAIDIDGAALHPARDTPTAIDWSGTAAPALCHLDAAPARPPRGLSSKSLARARQFMEDNIGSNFTLDQLARAACVSRAHFARLFRISTGTTPMAYLLKMRVEYAKLLLLRRQRVSDVAAALGFCDQSHFPGFFAALPG
jgi:AraC family transcriptional regulator